MLGYYGARRERDQVPQGTQSKPPTAVGWGEMDEVCPSSVTIMRGCRSCGDGVLGKGGGLYSQAGSLHGALSAPGFQESLERNGRVEQRSKRVVLVGDAWHLRMAMLLGKTDCVYVREKRPCFRAITAAC